MCGSGFGAAPAPDGLQDGLVVKALTPDEHVAPRRRGARGLLVSALSLTVAGAIIGGWWMWRSAPEGGSQVAAGPAAIPAESAARTEVAVRETPVAPEVAAPPPPPPPADLAAANAGGSGVPVPLGSDGALEAAVPTGAMAVAAQDSAPAPAAAAEEPKSSAAAESAAESPPMAASPPAAQSPAPTAPPPPMLVPATASPPASTAQPAAVPTSPPSPAPAAAVPDIDVSALLARGDAFLANADIAAAQLFYKRAAAEGSGAGALAMAGTLDPAVLRERRVPGARPHPAEAIVWYRQSIELGETRAQVRLDRLLAELRIAAAGGDEKARAIFESQR